jgi:hypothetical protein
MSLNSTDPAARSGWISQANTEGKLGVSAGILANLRRKKLGPLCCKFDHQEPFSYDAVSVEVLRHALLGIGAFGLKLHGMAAPLCMEDGPARVTGEAPGPLIPEHEMLGQLGISKRVAAGWRSQGIGPRCVRSTFTRPYDYQASDVAELRKHLLKLGEFGIALPGLSPLVPR